MARVKDNDLTEGLSGKFGKKIVFRQKNGITIAAQAPKHKVKPTEKQENQNKRFSEASTYAKNALQDPTLKAFYEQQAKSKGNISARNAAMSDFLNPPIIEKINTSAYIGESSDEKIIIEVNDNSRVVSLKVKITRSDKSLVEEGNAILSEGKWVYTTTLANGSPTGCKITVTATNRPGNNVSKVITL